MPISRDRTIRAIRVLAEALADALLLEVIEGRGPAVEPAREYDAVIVRVCLICNLLPSEYFEALANDPELFDLERLAIAQVRLGTTDPGPYDVISRESPAGNPSNYHLSPWWASGGPLGTHSPPEEAEG